jgi:hypothetical protein
MPHPLIPATLLALALPVLVAGDAGVDRPGGGIDGQITTMTFHERIIVRVPRLGRPPAPVAWKEKHGPRCIVASDLAGALVSAPGAVDLVLAGNRRVRARLDGTCEPLDFYSGFYLKPAADGKVCAGRDVIRSRSGSSCQIDEFRLLKPLGPKH